MKSFFTLVLLFCSTFSFSQSAQAPISANEAERLLKVLASDDMLGRKTFSASIDRAAAFIATEFKNAGLKEFPGAPGYRQEFSLVKPKFISASGHINNNPVAENNIIAVTTTPVLKINELSGYIISVIDSSAALLTEASRILKAKQNQLVLVSSTQSANFNKLKRFKRETFSMGHSVIFVLTDEKPASYAFEVNHEITSSPLSNVIGVLPGKSMPDEYVVFSAHYDHLGTGKPNAAMDSIYNGANDDASGTSAVIMLASYFSKIGGNERTIIFTTFTAEESGGYGSRYFSNQINPDKVVAMFNIEMIGTESKWGKNSAYITGYEKSDLGKILQNNLSGTAFNFEPDPYPKQNLFYRSDNATLAMLGVPAHTISTSKMDSEPYYHTLDDEMETLDISNMAEVIKAIAISSSSVISGKDRPGRIGKGE